MSADDQMLSAIQSGIRDITDDEPIVSAYVIIAAWVDRDGEQRLYSDRFEDQRGHETLGLLDWAQTCERRRVADVYMREE